MRNTLPGNLTPQQIDDNQRRQYELSNPKPEFAMCRRTAHHDCYFDDDKTDKCFICEEEVHYRPYLPESINKICMECFPAWYKQLKKKND